MVGRAEAQGGNRAYAVGLARAFGGAIIFGIPLLMTMEMWFLGFYLDRGRLLLFLVLNFFMLVIGQAATHPYLLDAGKRLAILTAHVDALGL